MTAPGALTPVGTPASVQADLFGGKGTHDFCRHCGGGSRHERVRLLSNAGCLSRHGTAFTHKLD